MGLTFTAKASAGGAAVGLRGGRPRKQERRTIEAIIWRLDNGAKWRSIPAELGEQNCQDVTGAHLYIIRRPRCLSSSTAVRFCV